MALASFSDAARVRHTLPVVVVRRVIVTDLRRMVPQLPPARFAFFAVYDGHAGHRASEVGHVSVVSV